MLLGNGDGTFQNPLAFDGGLYRLVADLNQDGNSDLVICGGNSTQVRVLLGNGDGSFQPDTTVVFPYEVASLAAGDFNGDHKCDLAAVSNYNYYFVLLGNGDGTFQNVISTSITSLNATSIAAADFNQDGRDDLALFGGTLVILMAKGDGTFQAPKAYQASDWCVFADFNHDGNIDIAASGGSCVSVYLGSVNGTFTYVGIYELGQNDGGGHGIVTAAADFDGDGNWDLASPATGGGIASVLFGNGDGTFHVPSSYGGAAPINSLELADFNHDGVPDFVITASMKGDLAVILGDGDGTFQTATGHIRVPTFGYQVEGLAVGDVDQDGVMDVVGTSQRKVIVFHANGNGTLNESFSYDFGLSSFYLSRPVLCDLNGDGLLDIAVSDFSNRTVSVWLGNGDGTFQDALHFPSQPVGSTMVGRVFTGSLSKGDFDGDGHLDLVEASHYGITVMLGNGDGSLKPPVKVQSVQGQAVRVADFNEDGKDDLAFTYPPAPDSFFGPGALAIMQSIGDGRFVSRGSYETAMGRSNLLAEDINCDGKADIVF